MKPAPTLPSAKYQVLLTGALPGFGVGDGVGLGHAVGLGVGFGVGFGVGLGVGEGVGLGVGLGVGVGVFFGLFVWFGVGVELCSKAEDDTHGVGEVGGVGVVDPLPNPKAINAPLLLPT